MRLIDAEQYRKEFLDSRDFEPMKILDFQPTVNAIVIPENATRREVFKLIFGIDVPRDIDLCEVFEKCEQCPLRDQESCAVERDFNPWFDELYRKE